MGTMMISTDLLDRADLDIYEKMCCIILARLTQEECDTPLSLEELARQMGCTVRMAGTVLEKLVDKGLLIEDSQRVIRNDMQCPAVTFETFDLPKQSFKKQLENLRDFIHEPASDGTLRIILNMAGGNVERIRSAYQAAAASQISDRLETLMHLLQKEEPEPAPIKAALTEELEPETRQVLTQINQKRIAELYSKSKQKRHL